MAEPREAIFKVRYWDYSHVPLNIHGYVCLGASLGWGLAAVLLNKFIHIPVERLEAAIPAKTEQILVMLVTMIFMADLSLSVKAALDIRDILMRIESIKAEAERMQKRVDVLLAVADDEKDKWVDRRVAQASEMLGAIENALSSAKDKLTIPEGAKEELIELRTKAGMLKDRLLQLYGFRDKLNRLIIKGNPNMVSKKFQASLNELKEYYNSRK